MLTTESWGIERGALLPPGSARNILMWNRIERLSWRGPSRYNGGRNAGAMGNSL